MTGSRAERIAEQRHAQIIEQLHRVNIGLESLNAAMDRMTLLQAETNGRLDGVVRHFVEAWQQLRQQERPLQATTMPDITLSIEDAAAIRKALVAALEDSGGGGEDEDDPALSPGLSEHTRHLETMLREAIRLLDKAASPAGHAVPPMISGVPPVIADRQAGRRVDPHLGVGTVGAHGGPRRRSQDYPRPTGLR